MLIVILINYKVNEINQERKKKHVYMVSFLT